MEWVDIRDCTPPHLKYVKALIFDYKSEYQYPELLMYNKLSGEILDESGFKIKCKWIKWKYC